MNNSQKQILLICQEECAEVTQAISKVFRFGIDSEYNGRTNYQRLTEEVGDLLCMIDLMMDNNLIDEQEVFKAATEKRNKLAKWSSVFKENEYE